MKLISNKSSDRFLRYFPEIDESATRWSQNSPAVCHGPSITVPKFESVSTDQRCFVFKVVAGSNCVMSVDMSHLQNFGNIGFAFNVKIYDYIRFELIQTGRIGIARRSANEGWISIPYNLKVDTNVANVLLADISIMTVDYIAQYCVERNVIINFSNPDDANVSPVVDFDTSCHYVIDYPNAIDGSCWNMAGKVYRHKSLYDMGRRHFPYKNIPKGFVRGGAIQGNRDSTD